MFKTYLRRTASPGIEIALSLPAHQEAVKDAFPRARLRDGKPYLLDRRGYWPGVIESVLERYNHTLEELNLLAYKLSQMTEWQIEVYGGIGSPL